MYEECISSAVKVLREGRLCGARDFNNTGDLNVELGLMCTDENDEEELTKMCGPLCWQVYDKDLGGFKKIMWFGIMKEFDCKMSSTWSVCGKVRAEAFTHSHLGQDKKEEFSQLDYIIGPVKRNDEIYIHNERRLWAIWDHHPIFVRIHEEPHITLSGKNQKMDGMEADNRSSINVKKRR